MRREKGAGYGVGRQRHHGYLLSVSSSCSSGSGFSTCFSASPGSSRAPLPSSPTSIPKCFPLLTRVETTLDRVNASWTRSSRSPRRSLRSSRWPRCTTTAVHGAVATPIKKVVRSFVGGHRRDRLVRFREKEGGLDGRSSIVPCSGYRGSHRGGSYPCASSLAGDRQEPARSLSLKCPERPSAYSRT